MESKRHWQILSIPLIMVSVIEMWKMSAAKEIRYQTVEVDGIDVNFPFNPYELQIAYMKKVYGTDPCTQTWDEEKNGVT